MSKSPSTFRLTYSRRIWRVTLNDAFYGDYRSRRHASDSMEAAAAALRLEGGIVSIVEPPAHP